MTVPGASRDFGCRGRTWFPLAAEANLARRARPGGYGCHLLANQKVYRRFSHLADGLTAGERAVPVLPAEVFSNAQIARTLGNGAVSVQRWAARPGGAHQVADPGVLTGLLTIIFNAF